MSPSELDFLILQGNYHFKIWIAMVFSKSMRERVLNSSLRIEASCHEMFSTSMFKFLLKLSWLYDRAEE